MSTITEIEMYEDGNDCSENHPIDMHEESDDPKRGIDMLFHTIRTRYEEKTRGHPPTNPVLLAIVHTALLSSEADPYKHNMKTHMLMGFFDAHDLIDLNDCLDMYEVIGSIISTMGFEYGSLCQRWINAFACYLLCPNNTSWDQFVTVSLLF